MKRITNGECAHSPNRSTATNEDVRLNNGVFEGGLGVVDLAMRLALVDETIDVGFSKSERHSVGETRGSCSLRRNG
jgi:hypothetical protein